MLSAVLFLLLIFRFDKRFQIRQAGAPEVAIVFEPVVDSFEGHGIQLIHAVASFTMLLDEVRAAQQAQMLANGRAGDRKGASDLSGGLTSLAQQVKYSAARGIG